MLQLCSWSLQGITRDYLDEEPAFEEPLNSGEESLIGLSFTKSKLYLDCVTPALAGEYTCVADTPTERITETTELEIGKEHSFYFTIEFCIINKMNSH